VKPARNDPCPCGSGKKFKKCCLGKDDGEQGLRRPETPASVQYQGLSFEQVDFMTRNPFACGQMAQFNRHSEGAQRSPVMRLMKHQAWILVFIVSVDAIWR